MSPVAQRPAQAPEEEGARPGDASERLDQAVTKMQSAALESILGQALAAMRAGRAGEAEKAARTALEIDQSSGLAWHIVAIGREKAGDLAGALQAYQVAFGLAPEEPELCRDVSRLALKLGLFEIAEGLLENYLRLRPDSIDALNNLAVAQREQMRFGQAIETLRGAIQSNPQSAMLWNTLASVVAMRGDSEQALVFYDEALRLAPDFASARFNRAQTRQSMGVSNGIIEEIDAAIVGAETPFEAAGMRVARAHEFLNHGDLARGWAAYEARADLNYEFAVHYVVDAPRWRDDLDLTGKRMLVIGEQGLGDEVLFAQCLGDLLRKLGPDGRLILAVEPRLVSLFSRSFPQALVGAHDSFRIGHQNARRAPFVDGRANEIDVWSTMGQPLASLRPTLESFEGVGAFLRPDAQRVDYWRRMLSGLGEGPKVGLLWKSMIMNAPRMRFFAPFDSWAPVLTTPGARFVNLQYGDYAAEIAYAATQLGVELWTPPGLDLKNDLDEVTALCRALDLVIGPANATTNLAGAAGGGLWLISTPDAWPRLGTPAYPWYPQARVFTPIQLNRWPELMAEIGQALRVFIPNTK